MATLAKIIILMLTVLYLNPESVNYKYVWASRLNLRNNPGLSGDIIKQINRGEKVKILEWSNINFEVTDTLFRHFSRFNKETKRFIEGKEILEVKRFKGKWIKVESNNQQGYVFDFYLSKLKPIPNFKFPLGNEIKKYLNSQSKFKQEQIGCEGCDDNYTKFIDNENEVVFESGIKGKCGYLGISINGILKSEGELIGFNLFGDDVSDACNYNVIDNEGNIKIIYHCCC